MNRTIEVELRYNLTNFKTHIDFKILDQKRIVDTYYDISDGMLLRKGIFIRNRNDKKVDFKFNLEDFTGKTSKNDHTHCDEYSFQLPFRMNHLEEFTKVCNLLKVKTPESFDLNSFLKVNGFIQLVTAGKQRIIAKKDDFNISLDTVKGLGRFIEVEKIVEIEDGEDKEIYNGKLNSIKEDIDTFVQNLNIGAI